MSGSVGSLLTRHPKRLWFLLLCASLTISMFGSAQAAFPLSDMRSFYLTYRDPRSTGCDNERYEPNQAEVVVVGGATEPPKYTFQQGDTFQCGPKDFRTVHRLMDVTRDVGAEYGLPVESSTWIAYGSQRWFEPCGGFRILLRSTGLPDPSQFFGSPAIEGWRGDTPLDAPMVNGYGRCDTNTFGGWPLPKFNITSDYLPQPPVRRRAVDGSEYDASPLIIKREGVPWYTHFWAYRLGLVASENNFNDADRSKLPVGWNLFPSSAYNFELAKLPPPRVEEEVTEYVNRTDFPNQPGGQFFYAVLAADKTLLDSLPQWQRTGKSFKSGGYVSVCRFYGGKNGGPNTHFYSADDKECAALKAIPQLSYEGQTFAVNMPMPAKNAAQAVPGALRDCPVDSKPLYRVYNNASASSGRFVSNHRYLTERTDVTAAVAQGWVDEGHVMCVPM